jgi:hypothetical protein
MPTICTKKDENEVLDILRPGDIINTVGHPEPWEPHLQIIYYFIRQVQHNIFPWGWYQDTHSIFSLGNGSGFEFTFPYPKYTVWQDIKKSDLTVWRPWRLDDMESHYQFAYWQGVNAAIGKSKTAGNWYDIGDLLDILLGYKNGKYRKIFGSKRWFVCSTGAAMIHEAGRKEVEKVFSIDMDRLFLGPTVLIEMVTPAHYANRPDSFYQVWPAPKSEKDLAWRRGWMEPEQYRRYLVTYHGASPVVCHYRYTYLNSTK